MMSIAKLFLIFALANIGFAYKQICTDVSDEVSRYMTTLHATGCPNPDLYSTIGNLDYWKWEEALWGSRRVFEDMFEYCTLVRDGSANDRQISQCCGFSRCVPSSCKQLWNWKVATCEDNIQNQGEEDIDCGGPCPDCKPVYEDCVPVSMTVKAAFRELSVSQASKVQKVVESSKVFNSVAESNSQSIEGSVGFKGFSASLKTEWSNAIETTSQVEGSKETYDESNTTFKEGFLQIRQDVTKTVRIGTNTATVKELVFTDSIPIDEHESEEQLYERARNYIEAWYGHMQNNGSAQIVGKYGNTFEMATCVEIN